MNELNSDVLKEMEQLKTQLAESQKLNEAFKAEKKASLVEKYRNLCKEKGLSAKDVSNYSEEVITLLTDQASEIKVAEKPLRGEVTQVDTTGLENYMYERSNGKIAVWAMPDKRGKITLVN